MGEGSHRRLSSSIRLESEHSLQSCEGIIIEKLPSGVFADPFELQHLVHRKGRFTSKIHDLFYTWYYACRDRQCN